MNMPIINILWLNQYNMILFTSLQAEFQIDFLNFNETEESEDDKF